MKDFNTYINEKLKLSKSTAKKVDEFVDLGLSVKWAKYNLGVDPNNLEKPEDWYGDYYSWGETQTKDDYGVADYKWAGLQHDHVTKYCPKNKSFKWDGNTTVPDDLISLEKDDDVAFVKSDGEYRMPTKEECAELSKVPHKWQTKYAGIKGLQGMLFTAENGNELFIPAARFKTAVGQSITDDIDGDVWSSNLSIHEPNCAYCLIVSEHGSVAGNSFSRNLGFSIRGVKK